MSYSLGPVIFQRVTKGYGLHLRRVGSFTYVTVFRASDFKKVAEFDAPYVDRRRDLYAVFERLDAARLPCPERDAEFTPERVVDVHVWRDLLRKDEHGRYRL